MASGHVMLVFVFVCRLLTANALQQRAGTALHDGIAQCTILKGIGGETCDLIQLSAAEHFFDKVPLSVLPFAPSGIDALSRFETPVALRAAAFMDHAAYDSVSLYHPTALGVFAQEEKWMAHRKLCEGACCDASASKLLRIHQKLAAAFAFTFTGLRVVPESQKVQLQQMWIGIFKNFGFDSAFSVMLGDGFDGCANMDTPWGLAKCVSLQVLTHAESDGWNANGSLSRSFNRMPFDDFEYCDGKGRRYKPYQVQNFDGKDRGNIKWNPLKESRDGFFFRQEHVTPYIGFTARWYGYSPEERCNLMKARKQSEPNYDYQDELLFALNETAALASNERMQMAVELFDNKFSLTLALVQFATKHQYTEFEFWKVIAASAFAFVNAASMVWRQKIISNLIRPTTVAQLYGSDPHGQRTYNTYAGPGLGLQQIPISNWKPYIRTMPHAEYPSGSSCLCIAWKEVSESATLTKLTGGTTFAFPAGSSIVAPGKTPSTNVTLTYQSWQEMSDACGRSRTDGGMHFSKSVQGGEDICKGMSDILVSKFFLLEMGNSTGRIADLHDQDVNVCEVR